MTRRAAYLLLVLLATVVTRTAAAPCQPQPPGDLGIDLSVQERCDPLVPERCLLPFPTTTSP